MYNDCAFCNQPNIVYCMNRSLQHKHVEQEDRYAVIIDSILLKQNPPYIKYIEVVLESEEREFLTEFSDKETYSKEFTYLAQYYKFRIFVPVYAKSKITDTILNYQYKRLKIYYNSIKRKLNLTVDPSSSSFSSYNSSDMKTQLNKQEYLLKDLKIQQELQKKKRYKAPTIKDYKTQSKALEQLMLFIKKNNKFDSIQTLKTEDCFNEQQMFEENQSKRRSYQQILYEPKKAKIHSRFFKKINEIGAGSALGTYKTKIAQDSGDRNSKSKSIKFLNLNLKGKDSKDSTLQLQRNHIIESPFRIKESPSFKSIKILSKNKKSSSLNKLQSFQNASPYKRKTISGQKNKISNIETGKGSKNSSNENIKIKNNEPESRIKQTLIKMQTIKFENQQSRTNARTTPNSPLHTKKHPKTTVEINKNDNILSIRKKKLQMLRERTSKK